MSKISAPQLQSVAWTPENREISEKEISPFAFGPLFSWRLFLLN